ncbi:hypothetical protein SASPL_130717 [Salvia splendens]|uniref:Cyclin-like domain-containing protein n=1 Tax=Salvia splendens TaxID=180675 RepID=A0A8X8X8Q9_SALSN|nr:hypothetical protein SASPL_130717 [Salvia splendens]
MESKFNRSSRNETVNDNAIIGLDVFTITGRSLGKGTAMRLDDETLLKAHQYVLFNSEAVRPYIESKDIIELDYGSGRRVVLFDCEWVSKGKRLKMDADGFTVAKFSNVIRHNEPFILASQAEQVFYVEDPTDSQWRVIVSTTARANYHMEPIIDVENYLQSNICVPPDNVESGDFVWSLRILNANMESGTLYLTVNLIDRFLAVQSVERKRLQLVGIAASLLACKYEEFSVPLVEDLVLKSDNAYSRKEVLNMEKSGAAKQKEGR